MTEPRFRAVQALSGIAAGAMRRQVINQAPCSVTVVR